MTAAHTARPGRPRAGPPGFFRLALFAAAAAGTAGCTSRPRGFIYTDTTRPVTLNLTRTPRGAASGSVSTTQFQVPLVRARLTAEWRSRAVGDAAKRSGLTDVYYADERTVSVLGGVYLRREVSAYGEVPRPAAAP